MKVLLVEDSVMFNELLSKVCRSRAEFSEVVSVTNATEAETRLAKGGFSLMILDIHLPDANGFDFSVKAIRIEPRLRILGMTAYCSDYTIHCLMRSPILGLIDKSTTMLDEIWLAIDRINSCLNFYSPSVELLISRMRLAPDSFHKILSPREIEILKDVGKGMQDIAIGLRLEISHETVKWHRRQIMFKLNLNDRAALVVYANDKGLTSLALR